MTLHGSQGRWLRWPSYSTKLTLRQSLELSPFDKWRYFGRPPLKFIIRLLISCLVVTIVATSADATFFRNDARRSFVNALLPASRRGGLFTTLEVRDTVLYAVQNYETFPLTSVGIFSFPSGVPDTTLLLTRYDRYDPGSAWGPSGATYTTAYNVSSKDLGPLQSTNLTVLAELFRSLAGLELRMTLKGVEVSGLQGPSAYKWDLGVRFSLRAHDARVDAQVTSHIQHTDMKYFFLHRGILYIMLCCLAVVGSALSTKAIVRNFKAFWQLRRAARSDSDILSTLGDIPGAGGAHINVSTADHHTLPPSHVTWEMLPISMKLGFFNFWFVADVIGDICLFTAGLILGVANAQGYQIRLAGRCFFAAGALFAWLNLMQYIESLSGFNILIRTLRSALGPILRFTLSCLPIFCGYVFAGVILFAECSDRFETPTKAAMILFAVLNGDEVRATIDSFAACPYPLWLGYFYGMTGTIIFIVGMLNLSIFIIEAAFLATKARAGVHAKPGVAEGPDHTVDDQFDSWSAIVESFTAKKTARPPSVIATASIPGALQEPLIKHS